MSIERTVIKADQTSQWEHFRQVILANTITVAPQLLGEEDTQTSPVKEVPADQNQATITGQNQEAA